MKQSLQLRLGQQLTMTPQLQQAIRLLQLSTVELESEVQDALESNLMLERDEDGPAEAEPPGEVTVEPVDIPAELAIDSVWEEVYDGAMAGPRGPAAHEGVEFEGRGNGGESLQDHLYWQMSLMRFSDADRLIGTVIVDAINEDGYFTSTLEDIRQTLSDDDFEVGIEEIEAVLHQIQNFDPPGVAARDLGECLCLQLRQMPEDTPWRDQAMELAGGHLEQLAGQELDLLMEALDVDHDSLREIVKLIHTLMPRPGAQIHQAQAPYVVPDVFVRNRNGAWKVELNPDATPRVRVNSQYASLIRRADSSADNSCLKTHLQEARWFIKSLKSRGETLLKVATCIVDRQHSFLEHGEEAMKPMVLHDVADAVGMHESTISRVTTNKYMLTPRGIYELKYFFSSHVYTKSGAECSSTAIRALLKKLIAAENSAKPLSDSKLASILSDQGIKVARRTVAKYREAMTIPASGERRSVI